jgi:chromosomal replication initiator protein
VVCQTPPGIELGIGKHGGIARNKAYNVGQAPTQMVTIETIQLAVAEFFRISVAELKENDTTRAVVIPRQIAMYLAKQMTEASLPEIGREFGGKHHTTVMHSIAKIDEQRRTDAATNKAVEILFGALMRAEHGTL